MAKKTPKQYYHERVEKEAKQCKFFTQTTNSQILNKVLAEHKLELTPWGYVHDNGCINNLFKQYLEYVVLPDIKKRVGIVGIKIHSNPTHLTQNLFKWINAEIDPELLKQQNSN